MLFRSYIGARRPILAIGPGHDVAADYIRGLGIGVVSDDGEEIAAHLKNWLSIKQNNGQIPSPVTPECVNEFTWEQRTRQVENLLKKFAATFDPPGEYIHGPALEGEKVP